MIRSTLILALVARIAFSQNAEVYRYNVTTDASRDTRPNGSHVAGEPEVNATGYVDETPSNYVERRELERTTRTSKIERYIPICCQDGEYIINKQCTKNDSYPAARLDIPPMYGENLTTSEIRAVDLIPKYGTPCTEGQHRHALYAPPRGQDKYFLLENATIFHDYSDTEYDHMWYHNDEYCWALVIHGDGEPITVPAVCFNAPVEEGVEIPVHHAISMIVSLPFFIATFVIYSILPELKTMHGITLRIYVACLFFSYVALITVQLGADTVSNNIPFCVSLAFVIHFFFLASFFWLNVMCFDIWWTFGGFRSLQGSVKQRERKKFSIYSAYAWGSATLISGICVAMDFVPNIPTNFIRPEFGKEKCWFASNVARGLYFYAPMGLTVICNIGLFISTALKISQHKKDTAHHLKGMDSRRHDDNKQWFNLYLKLFIVMGINWSMEIISWVCDDKPPYLFYITDLANTLQGVIIFVIFVWKDKIKRLLLRRLGYQDRSFQSGNSTRSAYHSSASRTCTTTAVMAPLHEKSIACPERTKTPTDESDCV